MDERLNDDDDEEHHRVFSGSFSVVHERQSVHAGCVDQKRGRAFLPGPSCWTAWPDFAGYFRKPAMAGVYGRVTER